MKKFLSLFFLPVILFVGCEEAREGAEEGVSAPGDYISATIRAQDHAQVQASLSTVQQAVQTFHASEGRRPGSLDEIVEQGHLPRLPDLPSGVEYQYDPRTGEVAVVDE